MRLIKSPKFGTPYAITPAMTQKKTLAMRNRQWRLFLDSIGDVREGRSGGGGGCVSIERHQLVDARGVARCVYVPWVRDGPP